MESFVTVIGIVSGVAGIIGLLLPAQGWKQRSMHVIYGFCIAVLAALAIHYQTRLSEISRIENQAKALLRSRDTGQADSRGFILAAFSFLEKHKDTMPDTYKRAVQFAENSGVLTNPQDDAVERLHQSWRMQDGESAMKQLLIGIAGPAK